MKVLRLPLLLIFLGSLLLALFFGWMLVQALHNDREAFRRDLAFQSKEQGITVSAARAGLERRVQVLANTLAADPVIRNLLLQAAREMPTSPARNAMLRDRLRANLQPYWEALRESGALELNLFLPDANDIDPLVSMDPPDTHEQHTGDSDYLLSRAQHLRTVVFGIEFDGQRATTGGVAPVLHPDEGRDGPLVGLLEVEFGVVPNVEALSHQLESGVAILLRAGGDDATPRWRVSESSAGPIAQWLDQQQAPRVATQSAWRVVEGDDGHGYLLTLVPLSQAGDVMQRPVTAVAIWKDISLQLKQRDELIMATWLRWGLAWLIAEACLLLLLWGTRRVTRETMLAHQQRLEQQKRSLVGLNQSLEAQKEALQTLNDIAALQETSFPLLVERALQAGAAHLDMPYAIANRIDGEEYIIQAAYSPDDRFARGQTLKTSDTFCSAVVARSDVVAFTDADAEGWNDHRCRVLFGLKSYIGAPIWVHGQRFGALAFSSEQIRGRPFDEADREFVRLLARWVGATLMRWQEVEARDEMAGRLAKIASQTPGMIYQYRVDNAGNGTFPYASEAIRTFYGISPEQAAQDASMVIEAIVEEDRGKVIESIRESRENLTPWHCEYRIQHPDGHVLWLAGQSIPEREPDGATLWHGFVHDVTERKRSERLKTEFISTVSHELRTPLTSISGSLGLIQGGALGTPPESMRAMLSVAHSNAQRLIMLINDLLDMEKLVAGKMTFQMQEQPLMPLIDQAIEANQAYADQFKVHYVVTERLDEVEVNIDAMRLQQVLSNLLSNAAKFSPPDMQVEVRVEAIGERVRVSVIDHGPGIPEAFHERIFQKFSQADGSSTRKQGGTGLGLAITRELVERMRGSISFFSEEGQGACFFFELPRLVRPDAAERAALTERLAGQTEEAGVAPGVRLLIVEDDPDTALLLAILIRRWGYQAEVAHTLEEALGWIERRSFDAITLDLMLPDGSGLTLLRQLREQPETRDLPVLVVSAIAGEGQLEIGGQLNAVDWLAKPFDERRLAHALKGSLKGRPQRERIMHVESDAELTRRVAGQVAASMTLDVARSVAEARYLLDSNDYGLISLDLTAPQGPGWEIIPLLSQLPRHPAVIILSEQALAPNLLGRVDTAIARPGLSAEELREAFDRQLQGRRRDDDKDTQGDS
ncbi:ATP-binding protein [Salinicola sp. JS01]|uniref:ATP-binding protein n=1 Tax=Salinicola sp. JS01 TaxID=3050071 RepID=UPI00255B7F02|nr:ATP-binding protein [Salinicola sp. JS01]WIX31637.1 ATP-binding protein [Salinicola sp. JS01]